MQIVNYKTELESALNDSFKLTFCVDLIELYVVLNHLYDKGQIKEKEGKLDIQSLFKDFDR